MGDQPAEGPAEQVVGAMGLDLADFGEVVVSHLLDRAGRVLGVGEPASLEGDERPVRV